MQEPLGHLLIAQSLSANETSRMIKLQFPKLFPYTIKTISFDEAVNIAPTTGKLFVLSSQKFYDTTQIYGTNRQKNGAILGKLIKEKNALTKICIYSNYPTLNKEVLSDEYIYKSSQPDFYEDLELYLKKVHKEILGEEYVPEIKENWIAKKIKTLVNYF